ncbi:MAG: hypothetical protein H6732_19885, partial [Alphaproteobacteria bacterium]|nr:hypothetical protein [Alphaproteobacteria bacterium]
YALVRTWISQLRSSLLASVEELVPEGLELPARPDPAPRMAQLQAWTGQAQAMPDDTLRAELLPLLADTRDAIDAEVVPLDGARDRLAQARSDRLEDLRLVKELKHRLRPSVSQAERGVDWATFGTDFVAELRLLGVQGLALLRERVRWLVAAPAMLVDMNRVGGATRRLVWSLVLLVVWLVLRRRAEVFADRCLDGAERLGVPLPRRARELLRPRVADVLLPVIDGSVAALLAPTAAALAPELGIVLRALAWSAVFGALRASVKVLFAQAGELRPALLLVDEEELALGQQTWTTLGVWWVAGYVLEHVLSELMFADAVGDFVALVIDLVGLVLVVVLAVRWEPRLLARVRRLGRAPAWLRRVIARTRVGPLAPVRAVVLGGYLGAAIVWDVLQGTAAQQDGYSALVAVMDRVRFGGEAEDGAAEAPSVLEPEVVARLTSGEVPPEVLVARPKAEAAVVDQLEGWRRDRRRGVLVLTGDRGDGKGVLLDRIAEHLVVDDLPARRGTLEGRLTSAKAVRGWIAGFTGLAEVPEDDDALVEALLALPSCVHVIRRTQRTFLRHVGGFEGLRTLLYVCNATSERHFWILGVHRPAWGYLSRIATLVNAGVVRAVVDVAPLSGPDLRELVLRRSQHAGIDVDFRRLENTGPFGAPPDVERERAIQSYFRLLAEASGGCPTIALELWARSLRPRPDGHADVVVVPELAGRKLADVGLLQLFVLAALRIQEDLTVAELSQVIDADEVDVRADVRELVQRGVLAYDGGRARVETLWLRGVTTVLRRRHILQWAA